LQLAFRRMQGIGGRLRLATRDGVLVTQDEEFLFILARIEGSSHDYALMRSLLAEVAQLALEEMDELQISGTAGIGPRDGSGPAAGVHVGLTGAPAIIVDYREILGKDIRSISSMAVVAVLVLFLLAFRRLLGLMIAAVPLAVGVIWTLGFGAVVIGEINVFRPAPSPSSPAWRSTSRSISITATSKRSISAAT
ncbi:MAG: MMPL family transporter, partial [Acidobacteriota bacterium]|nr:MMPL family transporter [Acidobacteriota bacterium]